MPAVGLMRGTQLALCAVAICASTVAAQAPSTRAETKVVNAVVGYRRSFLGDTTRFDACSVFDRTGRQAQFPQGTHNPDRVLLGVATDRCVQGRVSASAQAARHVVVVDSVSVSDSRGVVLLTVRHGEYSHRETFTLVPRAGGATWGVTEVRLWGGIQSTPPPPRP
jgi:hypothetical protein